MNYDEGEVACYPPADSAFEMPCFLDNDLMLMEEGVLPPISPPMDDALRPHLESEPREALFDIASVSVPEVPIQIIPDLSPEVQFQTLPCLPVDTRMQSPPISAQPLSRPQTIPQTRIITKPVILSPQAPTPVACYPPAIAFPFVPFWTGCPLPFDPRTYPQPVVPQTPLLSENSGNSLKEEKISKYRQKRCKRNFNRPVDAQRSSLAEKRPRDEKGKFSEPLPSPSMGKRVERSLRAQVTELKERLAHSETESRALREKLAYMEQELRLLKLTAQTKAAEDERPTEKSKLSSSPPSAYGFTSTDTLLQDGYTEKIDFSKIELRKTDSPHLEAERRKTELPPVTIDVIAL